MTTYILRYFRHGNWTTRMEEQWGRTNAVSRTVLHIPILVRVYQHPFKPLKKIVLCRNKSSTELMLFVSNKRR